MLIEVKVPQLPESVSEATLGKWLKKVGDFVARDENLVDVETDKVMLELPAPQAGKLVEILKSDHAVCASQELIARIDTAAVQSVAPTVEASAPASAGPSDALLMPAAKKLAADNQLDASAMTGTGRGGRVLKEDVQQAIAGASTGTAAAAPSAATILAGSRTEQRVPMSRLRQRIAERLVESQQTAAILTTFNEVNMKPVMDLRNRYKDKFEKQFGVKLGFMSFFVKAAIAALKKFPVVNASVDGTDIVYHGYFDIGIAVGSPRGLVVPILRDVDQMSIADIEKKIAEYGKRAQDGKLTMDELSGGTFTISNGGTFGSMMSTPIINPPQAAILGMHATKDRVVVEDGQMVIRPMMYLALSYDHRIIDGREAVLTLVAIKEALEDPARLLLDL